MKQLAELPEALQAPPAASDTTVPVRVLNIGPIVVHHGCVGIIRSLGRMGVPVYAVVQDGFTPATFSRYLTGAFIWETRKLDSQRFLQGMAMIGQRLNRPTIVIPTGDVAAILLAEHAEALRPWFLLPRQPVALPRALANKRELYLLCKQIGVACPETMTPKSIDDVRAFVERAAFPIVIKAAESWLLSEGERTASIARTPDEALTIYRNAEGRRGGDNLIFQEYIDPAHGEDWFYHGYRNAQSDCSVGFTGRKLRSYPPFAGPTALGKAIVNESLQQQAETLLNGISYSGVMDIDYRLDERDGQYKLLDFNPRIGAQFRLFEDEAGMDVARALYLDLTGKRLPRSRPVEGRTFIVDFYDVVAGLSYFRQDKLTLREWRASRRGTREWAWFSRDDPFPFVLMCIRHLLRIVERLLRIRSAPSIARAMPRYVRGLHNWLTRKARGARLRRQAAPGLTEGALLLHQTTSEN